MASSFQKNDHEALVEGITSDLRSLVSFLYEPTKISLVGSTGITQSSSRVEGLSDIDLLMLHSATSLDEYVRYFQQVRDISRKLSRKNQDIYDIFLLNSEIVNAYLDCLPCIWDNNPLAEDRIILTHKWDVLQDESSLPTWQFRHKLYLAKSIDFYYESIKLFPIVDGSHARKQAKAILRNLRALACVHTPEDFEAMERKVTQINSLDEILRLLESSVGREKPSVNVMQRALEGQSVTNWTAWVEEQESFVTWLQDDIAYLEKQLANRRFYLSLYKIWDMLTIDVKRVLAETSAPLEKKLKKEFIEKGLSLLTRIELTEKESFTVFDEASSPFIQESQNRVVGYLEGIESADDKTLASILILLEHIFGECVEKSRSYTLPV